MSEEQVGTPAAAGRWGGVDWSWTDHAVCVVDGGGSVVERLTIKHTAAGLARLVSMLHRHGVDGVAIERGDGPVVQALLEAGLTVFVVASRQVTALRSRYGTAGNKDDRFDAYLLADVLRTDRRRLTPLTVDAPETLGLRMLVRARQDLVAARVAAHNQLRAHLLTAFPGAVGLFAHLDAGISLKFLTRFPTARHARWLSEKRLAAWLAAAHYTRANTRTPAQLLTHLGQAPAGLPEGPAAGAAEAVTLQLVALLVGLRERIAALEEHIAQALAAHADAQVFTHLPRSGTVRAATLLAEIGDARGRYPSEDALAAAAGVSPSTRASGRARAVVFRQGCNGRLRQALVDFADGSRQGNAWAKAVYDRARARDAHHAHAVRILARAWIRVIWRCWTDHIPYDPARHGGVADLTSSTGADATPAAAGYPCNPAAAGPRHSLRRVDLVVRALTSADLPMVEPWFDDPESARWLGGREWPRGVLRLAAESQERLGLVAVANGEPVAIADIEKYPDARAAVAVVVAPARRGQGLAATFLLALEDHPGMADVAEFFAGVERGNQASFRLLNKIDPSAVPTPPDHEGFSYVTWRRTRPPAEKQQTTIPRRRFR